MSSLKNVVVENEKISRDILKEKCTIGFEKFMPLNKLNPFLISDQEV